MKTVIITGTSSGLGKDLFDCLYQSRVILVCISRRFLAYQQKLAKKLNNVILITQDLSKINQSEINKLFSQNQWKDIIIINNAGVINPINKIGKFSSLEVVSSINVNFLSPILLINSLIKYQPKAKITVLNITSGAATKPIPGWAMYCSTKAGMKMFASVLAKQNKNIAVYNLDPGVMDTNMQKIIRNSNYDSFPSKKYFINLQKQGRLSFPKTIAQNLIKKYIKI